jgi:hypothetical protein
MHECKKERNGATVRGADTRTWKGLGLPGALPRHVCVWWRSAEQDAATTQESRVWKEKRGKVTFKEEEFIRVWFNRLLQDAPPVSRNPLRPVFEKRKHAERRPLRGELGRAGGLLQVFILANPEGVKDALLSPLLNYGCRVRHT